jgi:FkbM family methyltransferase
MRDLDMNALRQLHLRLHNAGAALHVPGWKPVGVRAEAGNFIIDTDERPVMVASAVRWEHYRWGWQRRVDRLFRHFSVGGRVRIGPGDQVIDIGANVGEFSLGAAGLRATVLSIEGDPRVFACLDANTAGTPSVTAVQGLVWKTDEELTFYSEPRKADSSIFRPQTGETATEIRLRARPLDSIIDEQGIDRIDMIKCDAEGAEPEVLEGAVETLKRTRQIALDTGPERMGQETTEDCERILSGLGFAVSHTDKGRRVTFGLRT